MCNHKRRHHQEIHHATHNFRGQQYLKPLDWMTQEHQGVTSLVHFYVTLQFVYTTVLPWQQKNYHLATRETHISQTKHLERGSLDDDLDVWTPYVTSPKDIFLGKRIILNHAHLPKWKDPSCYDPFKDKGVKTGEKYKKKAKAKLLLHVFPDWVAAGSDWLALLACYLSPPTPLSDFATYCPSIIWRFATKLMSLT